MLIMENYLLNIKKIITFTIVDVINLKGNSYIFGKNQIPLIQDYTHISFKKYNTNENIEPTTIEFIFKGLYTNNRFKVWCEISQCYTTNYK